MRDYAYTSHVLVIFFALLAFLGWGTGNVFAVPSSRSLGSFRSSFWIWTISLLFLTALIPFYLNRLTSLTFGTAFLTAFLAVVLICSYLSFSEALRIGNASVTGTITGAFVAPVVILSILFFHERMDIIQLVAVNAVALALPVTFLDISGLKKKSANSGRSIALALFTMCGWAVYFTFIKVPVERAGWFWPDYISTAVGVGFLLTLRFRDVAVSRQEITNTLSPVALCALISGGGTLAYNIALSYGSAAIVAPISGAYPVLYVIITSLLFKESVTLTQRIGIGVTLLGIVGIGLSG